MRENYEKITASAIEKYLLLNGWERKYDFPNNQMMVFTCQKDTIAIPASEKLADFYVCLPRILNTISEIYEKSTREVVKGILASYHDLIEFRIKNQDTCDGKIPLEYAAECIQGIKELILYSACAEQIQQPICVRTTQIAKEALDKFKMAQTEFGSYIFNIDIKVAKEENEQICLPNFEQMDSSYEHRIVKRIGKAIKQVDEVVKDNSKFEQVVSNAYEQGITANMCDALLKMKPQSPETEIETKIRYASAYTNLTDEMDYVDIQSNHFSIISEISKHYRETDEEKKVELEGYVISLNKKHIDECHSVERVHIITELNGSMRTVVADLCDEDYRVACDSHKDGNKIYIYGVLDISNRTYRFKRVVQFGKLHN